MEGTILLGSQIMVNNVSVNFNTVLFRELCMKLYLPRGFASAAAFLEYIMPCSSFMPCITK
jgi:hypothetical protein